MKIKIKKLQPDAILPKYALAGDAGMDLFSVENATINPDEYAVINTGIAMEIPAGFVGLIWDKSGMANKGLKTVGGVVDSGYRGEIKIQVRNLSNQPIKIEKGNKVAQMLIQKVESAELIEVAELSETVRGDSRFGSTGAK